MTPDQMRFSRKYYISPFLLTPNELQTMLEVAQGEIDARQEVRNKELKLELAEKVQEQTGNDQNLDILRLELRVARKKYAKRLSEFDEGKPYVYQSAAQYGQGNYLKPLQEDRLKPIETQVSTDQVPVWEISEVLEDGSLKHLGYSGGSK